MFTWGKRLGLNAVAVFNLWVGYDIFAPLFHLPMANPLHAAGLLVALAVLRRGVR